MAWLNEEEDLDTVIIFAPNGVHVQWVEEQLPVHMPDRIDYVASFYRSGMKVKEKKALQKMIETTDKLRILTMNIESLSNKTGFNFAKKFIESGKVVMMAIDESQKIKTPSSGRTRNAWALGKLCQYRRILSGTPVTKGVEDLFAQLKFLDENILGFSSFITFKNRYCIMQPNPFAQQSMRIVGYRDVDHLQSKLDGYTYRVTKDECLTLPPKVYDTRHIELLPHQRKAYDQLKDELMTELDNGSYIKVDHAITALLRLHQIACGHAPLEEDTGYTWVVEPTKNPKMQVTMDLIEEAQGPVIVWCRFTADIIGLSELMAARKLEYRTYYGATPIDGNPKIASIALVKKTKPRTMT